MTPSNPTLLPPNVGECQTAAWRYHKKECTALQAERAQYKSEKKGAKNKGASTKPPVPVDEVAGEDAAKGEGGAGGANADTSAGAGAVAGADEERAFKRGDEVVLNGLKAAAHLNGERGVILGKAKEGRFPVRLKNHEGKKVVIKPANLTLMGVAAGGAAPRSI